MRLVRVEPTSGQQRRRKGCFPYPMYDSTLCYCIQTFLILPVQIYLTLHKIVHGQRSATSPPLWDRARPSIGLDSSAESDEQTLFGGDSDLVDERFGDSASEGELFAWSNSASEEELMLEMMAVLGSASREFNDKIPGLPP
ncbi:hypothetical protein ON010_g8210 [Phytophthora cinnamomi]|nr:hypothetical protein ON010_g8210 [Phytophthora cinnamomi]